MSPAAQEGHVERLISGPFGVSERQIKLDYPVVGGGPLWDKRVESMWAAAAEVQATQTGWWSSLLLLAPPAALQAQITPRPELILTALQLITAGQMFNILLLITPHILSQYAPK